MDNLNQVEYWTISEYANIAARDASDSRARIENDRILKGEYLEKVHTEALRDFEEIERLILGGVTFSKFLGLEYQGNAADLGSGVGTGAAIISRLPEIENVHAVEISEQWVLNLMPKVFSEYKAIASKIVRVVGDFNNLRLEDNSLSLIVEVDSFHHSENIGKTLKECYRVLKPGGVIISVDRAWADSYTRKELDSMLDKEYTESQKALFGIPADQIYRRRDNGEHEYTIKEWFDFYQRNGFDSNVFTQVHPPKFNKLIFLRIPVNSFILFFAALLSRLGIRRHYIYGFGPKKLFVCIKK